MTKFLHFNAHDQIRHMSQKDRKKFQSRTVAAEPLGPQQIMNIAQHFMSTGDAMCPLTVGITKCSLEDNYCKADGRDFAKEASVDALIDVEGVTVTKTHIFIHLVPYMGVKMNVRLNRTSGFSTVTGDLVGDS